MIIHLLLLFLGLISQGNGLLIATPSDYTVNTPTKYSFMFFLDPVTIPSNSRIVVIFPNEFSSPLTGLTSCSLDSWFTTIPNPVCTISARSVTVTGGFPSSYLAGDDLLEFSLTSITNPGYSITTSQFTLEVRDASNNLITSSTGDGVTINTGTLTCSISASGTTTVNSLSVLRLSITPSHPIPANGKIEIVSVPFWPMDVLKVDERKIFNLSGNTCGSVTNTVNTIQCAILLTPSTTNPEFYITATTLFNTITSINFVFTFSSFITPPTTQPQGSFKITSKTSSDNSIDICQNVVISGITAGTISNLAFSMNSRTINSVGSATFVFQIHNTIKAADAININFPSDFLVVAGDVKYSGNLITSNFYPNKTVTVTGIEVSAETSITLVVSGVTNPTSTKSITGFSVATFRNTYMIEQSAVSPSYQATAGTLVASVSPVNTQSSTSTNYVFTITLGNGITPTAQVFITFPTGFVVTAGVHACVSNQSAAPTCTYNTGTSIMTISSVANSALAAGAGIILTINTITNPASVGITPSMTISTTYSSATDTVDTVISGVSFTVTPRTLSPANIALSSTSYVVFSTAQLSFEISNFSPVLANSKVFIGFPTELVRTGSSCLVSGVGQSCTETTYNTYSGFMIDAVVSTNLAASGLAAYRISITGITMPTSTRPTSSFQIYIINPDLSVSEFLLTGLTIAATTPATFTSLSIVSSSDRNYQVANFAFNLLPLFPVWNNSIVIITLPTIMSSSTACVAGTGITSVTCTNTPNTITTTLRFTALQTVATSMTFSVNSMRNYPSLAQYSIEVALYESSGTFISSRQSYSIMNLQTNSISINSATFTPAIMAEATAFAFSITPSIPIPANGYILLTFPPQFTLGTILCTLPPGFSCSPTGFVIRMAITTVPTFPIVGSITGITAPRIPLSSGIYIQIYSSDSSQMTRDNSVVFRIACNLYCRTCSSNPSQCASCYSDASLVSGNILPVGTTCTSNCPAGQYQQSSTCIPCPTDCTACISSTVCTSCSTTTYLHNSLCINPCPDGFFPQSSNRSCVACSSALHCATCINSLACTSCLSPYYNYQNFCIDACPTPITIANPIFRTCDPCPTNCTECSGYSPSLCTKCTPGYLLDQNACALTCVTSGFVPSGLVCVGCNPVCLTCANTPNNCTACDVAGPNKYLFNHNCLSTCSGKYYNDNNDFTCVLCNPPCETCTSASLSSCLSCIATYYLYQNTCVLNCPDTFFVNGSLCSPCLDPCQKCSSASICTSCNSTLFFYNNNCVVACPGGMIIAPNSNICQNCSENCRTCVGATTQCETCYQTFYLNAGACATECPTNYYISPTNSCIICTPPCATCTSGSACVTCIPLYNLDGSACLTTCTGNKIPVNNVCRNCDPACLVCHGTTSNCSSCNAGSVFTEELFRCSSSCPSGYVLFAANNSCLTVCPAPYYSLSGNCTLCPTNCLSCVSSNNCTSCTTGLFLYNGLCYSSCPPAFPYYLNNECMSCNIINCQTCSSELCAACRTGYLLIKYAQCVNGCPDGQVYNTTALQCAIVITPNNTDNQTKTSSALTLTFAPAPIGIAAVGTFVILIITRAQHPSMSMINSFLPILSTLTLASAVINGLFYYNQHRQINLMLWLKVAGVGLYLILNFANALLECVYLKMDSNFQKTLKNRPSVVVVLILSALLSFKWFVFLGSSFCSMPSLKIKLSKDSYITALKAMFFSSTLALGCLIGSSIMYILTLNYYFTFLFFGAVELISLSAIEILLTFMSMSKMDEMVGKIKSKHYQQGSNLEIDNIPEEFSGSQENSLQKIPLYDKKGNRGDGDEDGSRDGSRVEILDQEENRSNRVKKSSRVKTLDSKREVKKEIPNTNTNTNPLKTTGNKLKTKGSQLVIDEKYQQLRSQEQLVINDESVIKDQRVIDSEGESNVFEEEGDKSGKENGMKKQENQEESQDELQEQREKQIKKGAHDQKELGKSQLKVEKKGNQETDGENGVGQVDQTRGNKSLMKQSAIRQMLQENQTGNQQPQKRQKTRQEENKDGSQFLDEIEGEEQHKQIEGNQKGKVIKDSRGGERRRVNSLEKQQQPRSGNQGDGMRRTDSCQFDKNKPYTPSSGGDHDIRSAFNRPHDVVKVPNTLIPQAIQQGLFNHDLNSIIQNQKKEDQESALEEAPKMNAIMESMRKDLTEEEMKRMIEREQEKKLQEGNRKRLEEKSRQKLEVEPGTEQQNQGERVGDQKDKGESQRENVRIKTLQSQKNRSDGSPLKNSSLKKDKVISEKERLKSGESLKDIGWGDQQNSQIIDPSKDPNNPSGSDRIQSNGQRNIPNPKQNKSKISDERSNQLSRQRQGTREGEKSHIDELQRSRFKTEEIEDEDHLESIELKQSGKKQKRERSGEEENREKEGDQKNQNRFQTDSSQSKRKNTNPLDPIDEEEDLALTMERRKKEAAPTFPDFNEGELEEDAESVLVAQMRTLQPKGEKKKRRGSDDDLESIATVQQVDIKLPTLSTQPQYKTLDPHSVTQRSDNRYLSNQDEDLQRPSQYFRPQKPKQFRPQVISVSSFGSFRSKQISDRLNNIGRMSLDNSFQKPKKPSSKQRK